MNGCEQKMVLTFGNLLGSIESHFDRERSLLILLQNVHTITIPPQKNLVPATLITAELISVYDLNYLFLCHEVLRKKNLEKKKPS